MLIHTMHIKGFAVGTNIEQDHLPGVVQGWAAILMGVTSGSVPWYTMTVLHDRVRLLRQVDDPMSIFHTHAVAGSLGGILTGIFAVPKLCRLFYMVPDWEKYIGLAYGLQNGTTHAGFRQMGMQLLGICFVICLNVAVTSLICLLVGLVVPLRLSKGEMHVGDEAIHGERGFALVGDGERFEIAKNNSVYDIEDEPPHSPASKSLGSVQTV